MSPELFSKIRETLGEENAFQNEPMKNHTSMEVGGPADFFFTPETEDEIVFVLAELSAAHVPFYIKGNGSNIIFRDEGFRGAVVEIRKNNKVTFEGTRVRAEAGILLKDLSEKIEGQSLTGFEFASGIPGSLGGAVSMNAGAYDGEMKDIVEEVTLLKINGGKPEKIIVGGKDMDFSYRHSICSDGDYVVLEAVLQLRKGDPEQIRAKIEDLTKRREEKQPLEYPSCGSTFKRPEGYYAGKLITDAGMKGYRIGGAQVSKKHAGFVINRDHATAAELLELIHLVQEKVLERDGVKLECEVKMPQ